MINIMSTPNTSKPDKTKPVLLVHGANANFWSFFNSNVVFEAPLPVKLVDDGFDVYFYMRAGDTF